MNGMNVEKSVSNTKSFYNQLLGLTPEWEVEDTLLDIGNKQVVIKVRHVGGAYHCPECGKTCKLHDHAPVRRWRHLDTCQMRTLIECRVPRVRCEGHKVKTLEVPWAEPHGRFTASFEAFAVELLLACQTKSQVCKLTGLSFDEIHHIQRRAVDRGLARREEEPVKRVGLDEKSMKKGHKYLTVLSEIREGGGRVLEVSEDRTTESAKALLTKSLSGRQRQGVESVSMDMWKPYEDAARDCVPNADVVFDKFHVTQHLGKAVDLTRRQEYRKLMKTDREAAEAMKNSKYLFLFNSENLGPERVLRFADAKAAAKQTAKAWECKEVFQAFWSSPTVVDGKRYLENWIAHAKKTGVTAMRKVAEMLERKFEGVLNYLKHRVTNAVAESLNAKIQLLKSTARGFRSFENYRTNILFYFGGLNLIPLKTL